MEEFDAVFLVEVHDNLAIRTAKKAMPASHQCRRKFAVVVDFAVADQRHRAILVAHRLRPRVDTDNAQTAKAQSYPGPHQQSRIVRSTVRQTRRHRCDAPGVGHHVNVFGGESADATQSAFPRLVGQGSYNRASFV